MKRRNLAKKQRRLGARAPGDSAGVVLPLGTVGSGFVDVSYTVSVRVGSENPQNLSLQVDTGSSDLWIASTSCSTSPCSQAKGRLYNPDKAIPSNIDFSINYLRGSVSGPIVWDQIEIGGYTIASQALAAARSVSDEALSPDFTGILGLAPPPNSVIAKSIPPMTSNAPDGATMASNLFGITPASAAPGSRFMSLSLARPDSDRVPSFLGIGRHPQELVSDPSAVIYTPVSSSNNAVNFWSTELEDITVWVDGSPRPVALSGGGPEAVLDSGVPLILTSPLIANGIYGALNVGPASDGKYYLPCTTPLNMTIKLSGRDPISLHPLDLTAPPPADHSSENCVGLIQGIDDPNFRDTVLGVPFLRNTYTVMAFDEPDSKGKFNSTTGRAIFRPRLGLLALTNPAKALDEFHTVRVLKQPLGSHPSASAVGGKKTNVGIYVLIGVLSFFGFCFLLFALRWLATRRIWGRKPGRSLNARSRGGIFGRWSKPRGMKADTEPTEDQLRAMRFETYLQKERALSSYSTNSAMTKVEGEGQPGFGHADPQAAGLDADPWNPQTALPEWRDTLVGEPAYAEKDGDEEFEPYKEYPLAYPPVTQQQHWRTSSEVEPPNPIHGASVPLLTDLNDASAAHNYTYRGYTTSPGGDSPPSLRHKPDNLSTSALAASDPFAAPFLPHPPSLDEFGRLVDVPAPVMTGIGTHMRGSRIDPDSSGSLKRHTIGGSIGSIIIPNAAAADDPIPPAPLKPIRARTTPFPL